MFPIKLLSNNYLPPNSLIQHFICHDCIITIDDMLNDMDDRLFIDDSLSYDEQMFLLNHPVTIEGRLIDLIKDRIHNLISDNDIHRVCLANFKRFSRAFVTVYHDDDINDDDNNETMVDFLLDDPNPFPSDSDDALETTLLDENDMEIEFSDSNSCVCDTNCVCQQFSCDSDCDSHQ